MIEILQGDALGRLRELPGESVQCCVTSPPYWGLRDYQIDAQLGLEKTPEEYVAKMVEVMREVKRVLRKDGTLWLNLGDSYTGGGGNTRGDGAGGGQARGEAMFGSVIGSKAIPAGLKPKDLCGIPWRVAFALQADGWWLRSDIIWAKPNPMPESVTDRPTKAHEYIFLLTKSASYFYDAEAIKEEKTYSTISDPRTNDNGHRRFRDYPGAQTNGGTNLGGSEGGRNKRSVWTFTTQPYPEAHFATFPEELPKLCILAGTSARGCCAKCGAPWERVVEHQKTGDWHKDGKDNLSVGQRQSTGGLRGENFYQNYVPPKTLGWQPTCTCNAPITPCTVLDPFAGSGTTGAVALELGRRAILIELNPTYVKLIEQRTSVTFGLPL